MIEPIESIRPARLAGASAAGNAPGARRARVRPGGLWRLAASVAVIGFVWLVVLPRIGRIPWIAEHSQWLEQRGVDPAAMYYTEVDALRPLLDHYERRGQ